MKLRRRFLLASTITMVLLVVSSLPTSISQLTLPVPREETVIIEIMPPPFTVIDRANPFVPAGTQWGSGWHQVVCEWDWYINYATGEIIYWRVTGWDYSEDYKTFTMYIRRGVTWNDGYPYTANDIEFTINMVKANATLSGSQYLNEWVDSIETPDDYTIVINLKKPNPRFHHTFRMWGYNTYIAAEHVWKDKDPGSFKNWPPVDTGPYKLYGVYPDLNLFIWERRDDYWGKAIGVFPAPKYVVWRGFPAQDIDLEDFVRGDVDVTLPHTFTWQSIETAMQRMPGNVTIAPFTDPCPLGVCTFNVARYPMNITAFRWAIQYLVDRPRLARAYLLANGTMATEWNLPMPYSWAIFDRYKPMVERAMDRITTETGFEIGYDPARAEQILDDLGFTRGADGWRTYPNGTRLTLELVAGEDPSHFIAYDLADQLKAIGIDVDTRIVPPLWGDLVTFGYYDISVGTQCSPGWIMGDPVPSLDVYHSKWITPIGVRSDGPGVQGSQPRYSNPDLDALIDQLWEIRTEDPEAEALLEEAFYQLLKDCVTVPAVEKTFVQTFSNYYWLGWPSAEDMYIVPYDWWPQFFFVLSGIKSRSAVEEEERERAIAEQLAALSSKTDALEADLESLDSTVSSLSGQITMLMAGLAIEFIIIIVVAFMLMRKK